MKQKRIFIYCLIVLLGSACKHAVDYSSYPEVKYSTDVNPIIIANCTQSGCHGTIAPRRFDLLTYQNVANQVVPDKPNQSELYTVIRDIGNNRMPTPPLPALTDDQIKTIYLWIGQGAKNN
jgi:hypothetical protein